MPSTGAVGSRPVNIRMGPRAARLMLWVLLLTAIAVALIYREHFAIAAWEEWLRRAGWTAPLVFMLLYVLAAVLLLPGSVLTIAGGALFGPYWGTFYNLTGATLGATLAFLIARYLAGAWVAQHSAARLQQLMAGVEAEGWRFVAFVRLVPLFPYNLLNYALGLTPLRLSHYIVTTYLCMLPATFAYTYLGYAGREALAGGQGLIQKGLLALALLALVVFLPRFIRRFKKKGSPPVVKGD